MAIDTEDKRRSAQQGAAGVIRPLADNSVDEPDRAQAAWFYSGFTYSTPAVEVLRTVRKLFTFIKRRLTPS